MKQWTGRAVTVWRRAGARYVRIRERAAAAILPSRALVADGAIGQAFDGGALAQLFDAEYYVAGANRAGFSPGGNDALEHWLQVGSRARIVPTPLFDEAFYLKHNDDVARAGFWGFGHFLASGMLEGRAPHYWFDAAYRRSLASANAGAVTYASYLSLPSEERGAPCARLARFFGAGARLETGDLAALVKVGHTLKGGHDTAGQLVDLFVPDFYRRLAGLPDLTSDFAALIHFLTEGLEAGLSPTPLFDEAHYSTAAGAAGLPPIANGALLHWLRYGVPARIVPTPLFDQDYYLQHNQDVAQAGLWGFGHFSHSGIHEGRRPYDMDDILWNDLVFRPGIRPANYVSALLTDLALETHRPDAAGTPTVMSLTTAMRRQQKLVASPVYAEIFARASRLEPAIGEPAARRRIAFPPYHTPIAGIHREIRSRLRQVTYDSIVCVPFGHLGGADLVAGILSKSIRRAQPNASILILRTDRSDFKRPDWYDGEADNVDISDLMRQIDRRLAEFLLFTVFQGLSPKRIFNVNSNLCWTTFGRYGARLSRSIDLFGYLFCWDLTETGRKVGYPGQFFPGTFPHLRALLTDNDHLRSDLIRSYAVPDASADKIVRIWTPANGKPREASLAAQRLSWSTQKRPMILWAGRLDRQKRFDLVVEIARLMPDVDFRCWGVAVLDDGPVTAQLPANVQLNGSFRSVEDLPLEQADGWLYTSGWDGLPTILIELAMLGMPIVASAVGGVPELIDAETGWPVDGAAGPEAYVAAIRELIAKPDERLRRGEALQSRAKQRHTERSFDHALAPLLSESGRRSG